MCKNANLWGEEETEAPKRERVAKQTSESESVSASGTIDKILFRSEDERFAIATLMLGSDEPIVIAGNLGLCSPGEEISVTGAWVTHPKYGKRLAVEDFVSRVPKTLLGLKKFLASGLIPGIGEKRAAQIVDHFGESTVEVLDESSERLSEIPGIGKKTAKQAVEAWNKYRGLRELLVFLQSYGVSVARGMQIFKEYGAGATSVLASNPYKLADDIAGIGFKTADAIAKKLGLSFDDPERIKAGASYVLQRACEKGHTYLPKEALLESARELLEVEASLVSDAYESLLRDQKVVGDPICEDAVFLPELQYCEHTVAEALAGIASRPSSIDVPRAMAACSAAKDDDGLSLSEEQSTAVKTALTSKVVVITGGPGTGKTALVRRLVRTCLRLHVRLALCAPTGRAAKRLTEATGFEAKTVHRLLEFNAFERRFKYGMRRKLPADLVVIDEASMVDVRLMSRLLSALAKSCSLVIVGDADQLPPVGPGAVLNDIIASGAIPVVRLSHIFRQTTANGADNLIVVNAHRINQGNAPVFPRRDDRSLKQFYFIDRTSPEDVLKTVVELARERIPARFGFNPLTQMQVITPMHRGRAGTGALNEALQNALNGQGTPVQFGGRVFRVNDKVMQTKNNYDKEVFNGDIGVIRRIDRTSQKLMVEFDDREVAYSPVDMSELELAYAISVHKSQGSEYDAVILPLLTQHYMLLQRNLVYTAVTRARSLVVMVGHKKALFMAIGNDKTSKRYTLLAERLKAMAPASL